MDFITLIAACALSVEPKVMHALIWEQSNGEPWSFSVPGESLPRVLPTIQDAIREARAARPEGDRIRVGLTGLSTTARSATAAMFAPCPNITARGAADHSACRARQGNVEARPDLLRDRGLSGLVGSARHHVRGRRPSNRREGYRAEL